MRQVYQSASKWQRVDSWISIGSPALDCYRLGMQASRLLRIAAETAGIDLKVEQKSHAFGTGARSTASVRPEWAVLFFFVVDASPSGNQTPSAEKCWADLEALPPDINSHVYFLYAPEHGKDMSEEAARSAFDSVKSALTNPG